MEKRYVRHTLFWIAYVAFEIYTEVIWLLSHHAQLTVLDAITMSFLAEISVTLLIKIPMVYLMLYFLKRYTVNWPNRAKLAISIVGTLILFSLFAHIFVVYVLVPEVYHYIEGVGIYDFQGIINSFMDKIWIACVAIALKQHSVSQKLRQREQALVTEKLETELNFLKSQINPHFLFNTLNSIYSLARKKSEATPNMVLKLSELLRFVLYEAQNPAITIAREIQFLDDYIALQKIRYDGRLSIRFGHEADNPQALIMPMILIPFVENAFKHGAGESTSETYIHISLLVKAGQLVFTVENNFESGDGLAEGIGLKNLRRQLELTYPDFKLTTNAQNNTFTARLSINLNQHL